MIGPASNLPEGWPQLRSLVASIAGDGVRLYRWEERFAEDGDRRRAVHLVPELHGTPLEPTVADMLARARVAGFRAAPSATPGLGSAPRLDEAAAAVPLRDDAGRALTVAPRQLPPRVVVTLVEPRAWGVGVRVVPSPPPSEWARDPTLLPRVAPLLTLASRIGPTRVVLVDRFAESDPDPARAESLSPPTLRAILRGAFALGPLCAALAAEGYEEDGEPWVKEDAHGREEVFVRDGEIELTWVPGELAAVPVARLSRSTRPPPVA